MNFWHSFVFALTDWWCIKQIFSGSQNLCGLTVKPMTKHSLHSKHLREKKSALSLFCCKSWSRITISSALGSLVISSNDSNMIQEPSQHFLHALPSDNPLMIAALIIDSVLRQYASCILSKINLFVQLEWKGFHSPRRTESIAFNRGKSLRWCLKHSASWWFLQFM